MANTLTKYEATRVIGLRALHLAQGGTPNVIVADSGLQCDPLYVAALELSLGRLDVLVQREDQSVLRTSEALLPPNLAMFLDTCDGGVRSLRGGHDASAAQP